MKKTMYIEIGDKKYPMRFGIGAAKALSGKFGSLEKMVESLESLSESEIIDAMIWIIEALIRQGCAYKNVFESDLPIPENAPVKDGKYIPLTSEEIEIGLELANINDLKNIIYGTVVAGSKAEIETKPKGKDAKNAQTA